MKAKLIFPLVLVFCLVFGLAGSGQALAERLILSYCPNGLLQIEYLGPKLHTWGPNDVESVQWDRIQTILDDSGNECPQIYLEVYDGRKSPIRVLWAFQLPLGQEIIFYAQAHGVKCGKTFQIFADVWTGSQVQRKYWALGPDEPIPATLILHNVEKIEDGQGGWVFRTTCPCSCH